MILPCPSLPTWGHYMLAKFDLRAAVLPTVIEKENKYKLNVQLMTGLSKLWDYNLGLKGAFPMTLLLRNHVSVLEVWRKAKWIVALIINLGFRGTGCPKGLHWFGDNLTFQVGMW